MAVADVILSINSKLGPGGMASLQAGIQMVGRLGKKVVGTVKDLEKFSQVYQRIEVDISKADAATKGLVDTMDLMKNANKFTAAQMEITGEQFKSVAVLAADMAKKMGTTVTAEMNALTDAITRGSTRALKRYGLDLINSEDLLLAQAEAIEKVTERSRGMTVEIETLSEALFVLGNNADTTAGLLFTYISGGENGNGILGSFNDALGYFNKQLMDSDGAMADFVGRSGFMRSALTEMGLSVVQSTGLFGDWSKELDGMRARAAKLLDSMTELRRIEAETKKIKGETAALDAAGKADAERIRRLLSDDWKPPADTSGAKKKKAKSGGGGGGGGGVNISRGTAGAFRVGGTSQLNDLIGTPAKAGISGMGMGAAGVYDEVQGVDTLVKAYNDLYEDKAALIRDEWELTREAQLDQMQTGQMERELLAGDYELRRAMWEDGQAAAEQAQAFAEERETWWAEAHGRRINSFEMLLGVEQNYVNESTRIWQSGLQGKLSQMEFFFGAVAKLQNVGGRRMFNVFKGAAYAENLVSTALAMQKSYSALSGIPIAGPALGAAAAAAAGIFGGAMGKRIREAKYGGGGGSVGSASIPSIGAGGAGQTPGGPSGGGGSQAVVIEQNISLTGGIEGFMEVAVEENDKRGRHGQRTF